MTIDSTNVNVDIFTQIRALLVAANLKVTNSTTAVETAATISGTFSDKSLSTPQVLIDGAEESMGRWKFSSAYGKSFINVAIDCYYPKSLGVAQLTDQVKTAILENDWGNAEIEEFSTTKGFLDINGTGYKIKTLSFTFTQE